MLTAARSATGYSVDSNTGRGCLAAGVAQQNLSTISPLCEMTAIPSAAEETSDCSTCGDTLLGSLFIQFQSRSTRALLLDANATKRWSFATSRRSIGAARRSPDPDPRPMASHTARISNGAAFGYGALPFMTAGGAVSSYPMTKQA